MTTDAHSSMLDAALALAMRWEIFPGHSTGAKKSHKKAELSNGKNWGMTKDPEEIKGDFKKWLRANIGLPTGKVNGIFVIECDKPEAHKKKHDGIASLQKLEAELGPLPETLMAESPSGGPHYYFEAPDDVEIGTFPNMAPGIDVRGEGGMVLAPPSIRPGVGVYRWLNEGTPIAKAPPWLIELASRKRKARSGKPAPDYLIGKGKGSKPLRYDPPVSEATIVAALNAIERNNYAGIDHKKWIAIGCGILKDLGEEKAHDLFKEWSERGSDYSSNFEYQWDSLVKKDGYGWSIGTLLKIANEADPDWRLTIPREEKVKPKRPTAKPKPQTKDDESTAAATYTGPLFFDPWAPFIVPDFPFDVLPPVLREFVAAQGDVIGGDPSAMAMAALAACSGAIDHRFALKIMKHGDWYAHPRLWVLLVGPPSSRRTPVINSVCAPLEDYQSKIWEEHRKEMQEYKRAKEKKVEDLNEPPPPIRYVLYDATMEKLAEILNRKPKGCLMKRDEFAGLIGAMEQYGKGTAGVRAFYLKAYDGGPFDIDRIVRGENHIQNLSLSMIGGIQPARLAELHGLTSDGFLQRCLVVMMRPGENAKDLPAPSVAYHRLILDLIEATPIDFRLTDDALRKMEQLRNRIFGLEKASVGLWAGFDTFIGKLHGVAGTLALILHIVADPKVDFFGTGHVPASCIEDAERIVVNFLIPHAREFYQTHESATNGDRIRQLASYILTSGETRFTASDFTRNVASMRGLSLREVNERVSTMVAGDWLDPDVRGLDARSWKLNGHIAEQFAERRRLEEEQKPTIARLMGSPRKGAAS
jgi:uncharacterized protein DUF3987/bifunctional DNA primase/polymerase-like protein/primase-like protein